MSELAAEIKQFIIDTLALEEVTAEEIIDDQPLFGEGLGLDSIDALELGVALSKKYGVTLEADSEESKKHFRSVASLCELVQASNQAPSGTL
jgi:acyl carrier protein